MSSSRSYAMLLCAALAAACARTAPPATVRLVDLYHAERVENRVETPAPPRLEWRFDGAGEPGGAPLRGWQAGPGIAGLAVRQGRLAGRTTTDFPVLHLEWKGAIGNLDSVHAVEVRLQVSSGQRIEIDGRSQETVDLTEVPAAAKDWPWDTSAKLEPGGALQTVTLEPPRPVPASSLRHLLLRPTDRAGAEFAIESVRVILRREHLQSIASGLGWQGLAQVYRETLVARAPESMSFEVTVPPRAFLDLGVGTVEDGPVEFAIEAAVDGAEAAPLWRRTVTTAHRWEPATIDLERFAGKQVTLRLSLAAAEAGALGFWGAPAVRARVAAPAAAEPPQGVIVIWTDTLRRDHLSAYGYGRDTSPEIARLAAEGTRFDRCVSQATWTKVATPSLFTSLYPSTHGVTDFSHRLPAAATTIAEVFRAAGFATLSLSSILFTGQFTNLHQGFEELHEDMSLPDRDSSKTARVYVDRLLPWLERHREVPFFVFLHVSDPHDPFEPAPPYNARWSDPAGKEAHQRQNRDVRKVIADPLLRAFGMPTRDDLVRAGFDADAYVEYDRGWYDGSIRAMDVEIGRLRERLLELGLDRRTLVVLVGDHGEEFLDHGRTFHGQSTYGELANVPLIFWRPGTVPAGKTVTETVETIDVMPTILEAAGLAVPREAQGTSLAPLLAAGGGAWRSRPAFVEKHLTPEPVGAPPPRDTESFAVVDGDWKLVHNTVRPRGGPEFELYDVGADPFDRHDLAAQHPEVVERLRRLLTAWHGAATAARLPADAGVSAMSAEERERLRSLGYLQ